MVEAALGLIGRLGVCRACATTKKPFLNPALLRDRNFVTSVILHVHRRRGHVTRPWRAAADADDD